MGDVLIDSIPLGPVRIGAFGIPPAIHLKVFDRYRLPFEIVTERQQRPLVSERRLVAVIIIGPIVRPVTERLESHIGVARYLDFTLKSHQGRAPAAESLTDALPECHQRLVGESLGQEVDVAIYSTSYGSIRANARLSHHEI